MANTLIKAERVVRTALGLLERDLQLPRLVWRDAAGDFRGAKGDTITIRLPSYFNANKRSLRAGTAKTSSELHERSVDVTLDDNLYGVIPITDEELTLDIESFNRQITSPVLSGITRGLEDEVITEMTSATYENSLVLDGTNPHETVNRARKLLNNARVPFEGRALAIGSDVEEILLNSAQFVRADQSGSDQALREAEIGRVSGFPVFTIPGLAVGEAYAFHRTAYVLNQRAPFVPEGVAWGASESFEDFTIRVARQVDSDELIEKFHADVFVGTNHVTDHGSMSGGTFEPTVDPSNPSTGNTDPADDEIERFVRAVKITTS